MHYHDVNSHRMFRREVRENMVQKLQESGSVLFNRQIAEGIYHLSVLAPRIAAAACPGQFVQVKVASEPSVQFLRMPFASLSMRNVDAGSVDICYQVVGDGPSS